MSIRCEVYDGKLWFPVIDIVRHSKVGGTVHKSASSWLKRNLPVGGIKKIKCVGSVVNKGGNLLCVDSDSVRIVGMYESHLKSGMDFRVKWADLPDTPVFDSEIKRELSWKNLYKWSKTEHHLNTGLDQNSVSKLRAIYVTLENRLDREKLSKLSLKEAVSLISEN